MQGVQGVVHGVFLLNVIPSGLKQLPRSQCNCLFRVSNAIRELGGVGLEKSGEVEFSPRFATWR
jgi:hypothetical protein